jgi:hypothetical protein
MTPSHDQSPDRHTARPVYHRATTFEGPTRVQRDMSPAPMPRLSRVPTEPSAILANRAQLRPVKNRDTFADPSDDSNHGSSSPYRDRSPSPATSYGSGASRSASWTTYETSSSAKKAPPPPPPSRSKKPPPPPPPMKRSALNVTEHA